MPHQTAVGFVANVTRTLPHTASTIHAALDDPKLRRRILARRVTFSTNRPGKVVRFAWGRDGGRVVIALAPKPGGRCQVAVQHEKMATRAEVAKMKVHWLCALTRLTRLLED